MMSEKENKSEDSNRHINYERKISELEKQNEQLKNAVTYLETSQNTESCQKPEVNLSIPDILVPNSYSIGLITKLDRSPPDGQEIDDESLTNFELDTNIVWKNLKSASDLENGMLLEDKRQVLLIFDFIILSTSFQAPRGKSRADAQ